ncbi:MAG: 4Fe-4S binding protein [Actinomycetota bacterium]
MAEDLYERLAKHLDEALVGAPMSPTLMEIVPILYPDEEAEVACSLSFFDAKTVAECEEMMPEKADRLAGILDSMAHRGTVFTEQRPGRERVYRLLPSVVGYVEAPFLAGKDTPDTRALAPLWKKYVMEEYGGEMARGVPLIRVIPISESLADGSEVLPFDAVSEKLAGMSFMAVGHCPCRQITKMTGEGCGHELERCMHFGSMGRYFVEMGMARRIELDEALEILRSATEEGLVHVCDNIEGSIGTICNCCSCCCGFFRASRGLGLKTYSRSNYVARVDADGCIACGLCEDRCPVEAVSVDDVAAVDPGVCIGCGVCTPTCGGEDAVRLVLREEVEPPPDVQTFVTARLEK